MHPRRTQKQRLIAYAMLLIPNDAIFIMANMKKRAKNRKKLTREEQMTRAQMIN